MGDVAQLGARRTLAHVFVRLIGFGTIVTPYVPFRVERASPDGTALAVTTSAGETTLNFRGDTPASAPGIADVAPGTFGGDWWLETSIYRCPWPSRFVLVSTSDPASTAKYDLVGPANSLIYLQGPFAKAPADGLHGLAGPGQIIRATGRIGAHEWVRLTYSHAGALWEQAHVVVATAPRLVLVVTMQAPKEEADASFDAVREIVAHLTRT